MCPAAAGDGGRVACELECTALCPEQTLPECLSENQCLDFDLDAPVEGREGFGVCLVSNDCLVLDEEDNLDAVALAACLQPVPIVNPNPPCEEYLDLTSMLACLASCGELEDEDAAAACSFECIMDTITFGRGLETLYGCVADGGACSASARAAGAPLEPDYDWIGQR
jgi:hypothetical protein